DEYLWEIFEWSCRWADGVKKRDNVFAAIWGHFTPPQAPPAHDSGLTYWKNQDIGIAPAQDMVTAIQSQDDPDPLQQNAASCIVFDRMLINCCAAHGIRVSEIKLERPVQPGAPPPNNGLLFNYLGVQHRCIAWNDTTIIGQANTNAPAAWGSHWIATVKLGRWKFYDASYGEGPVNAPTPGAAGAAIDVFNFEPHTVQDFRCRNLVTNAWANVPRSANRATPPHLTGEVLWTNG